jgi:hypothetical protein
LEEELQFEKTETEAPAFITEFLESNLFQVSSFNRLEKEFLMIYLIRLKIK